MDQFLHIAVTSLGALAVIGGGLGGLYAIIKAARAIYRTVDRIADMWRLVMYELAPNGGESMKDRITSMAQLQADQGFTLAMQADHITSIRRDVDALTSIHDRRRGDRRHDDHSS